MSARGHESTRVQLCGRLSVEIGGAQLADRLRGRQVRLLLSYLLLNRLRYVGREELIGALWPDQAPISQDAALRTLLSRLRSAIGSSALSGRDELILALPEPVWVDLEAAASELQRAVQALERMDARGAWALAQVPLNIAHRGLLPGVQSRWLDRPRRELEDIRMRALEVVGEAGLRIGGSQLTSVERAARSLIEAEPYRESGYALLIQALAAEGNAAEATRAFERLRTLLRDELGTTPSPEAIALHDRLLQPVPALAVPGAGEARVAALELPSELRARSEIPLVGRRREMAELTRAWELAARRGPGPASPCRGQPPQIICLAGDAGIGKTSLAAELARRVHDEGGVVLAGRAPREALVAYQPFLDALRHYFAVAPLAELRAALTHFGPELARLVPELRRRLPELAPAASDDVERERYRLFEAVVDLFSSISARAPFLLVLDDLQWTDRPTLLLLRHLARAADPVRLLVLIAYRTEGPQEALGDVLADLRREGLISQLDIGGLSEPETAELIRLRSGEAPSQAFTGALHAVTEGNPFFIEEILRHQMTAGVRTGAASASELRRFGLPEGVKEVISRRLALLEPKTIDCLRVAAVIGRDFDAGLVEQLVSLAEDEFLSALEEALGAALLFEQTAAPGRYSFRHALIREALYEGMSSQRRARIHGRVGDALEQLGDAPVSALAYHFTRAAEPADAEKAITYAARAGEVAAAMLSHEDAAEHYSRALEVLSRFEPAALGRRTELLLVVGEARLRSGERSLAGAAFREAAALAEELGDVASLARAAVGAAQRYVQQPGVVDSEVIGMLWRGLALTDGQVTVDRVRLLSRLCGAVYYSPERDRMLELSEQATALADQLGDPEARAYACAARRRALWDPTHLSERLAASTEMLTFARRAGDLELQLQAHAWLVVDLLEQGDRAAVEAQIDAFTAGAEELRQPLYHWQEIVWRGMRALLEGHLQQAEEIATEALAAGAPAEEVAAAQYYAIQLLATRREQGRIGELEPAARQMVASNPTRPGWRAALTIALCEGGQLDQGRIELEQLAAADFRDIPHDGDWITTMTLLCDACTALGDRHHAERLYEALRPYSGINVVAGFGVICFGSAARFLGKLAATLGRSAAAAEHLEQALADNARLDAPALVAHTQLDLAAALGEGARAQRLLDEAAATAAELGLTAVARRAAHLGGR